MRKITSSVSFVLEKLVDAMWGAGGAGGGWRFLDIPYNNLISETDELVYL